MNHIASAAASWQRSPGPTTNEYIMPETIETRFDSGRWRLFVVSCCYRTPTSSNDFRLHMPAMPLSFLGPSGDALQSHRTEPTV